MGGGLLTNPIRAVCFNNLIVPQTAWLFTCRGVRCNKKDRRLIAIFFPIRALAWSAMSSLFQYGLIVPRFNPRTFCEVRWQSISTANLTLELTRQFRVFSAHQSPLLTSIWFGCAYKELLVSCSLVVRTRIWCFTIYSL